MKKYSVYEEDFEFRGDFRKTGLTEKDVRNMYGRLSYTNPTLLGSFDSIEEARVELKTVHPVTYYSDAARGGLTVGKLGYIAEEEYDEDGELEQCVCITEYTIEPMEAE